MDNIRIRHTPQRMEVLQADYQTFRDLGRHWLGKDHYHVFFERVGGNLVKDKTGVYEMPPLPDREIVRIPEADPSTFSYIGKGYGRDSRSVYFKRQRIVGVKDPDTFRLLRSRNENFAHDQWAKDGFYYYWGVHRLEGIDYDSFEILLDGYARDKDHMYFTGEGNRPEILTGADRDTFEVLRTKEWGMGLARDKNHLYEGPVY